MFFNDDNKGIYSEYMYRLIVCYIMIIGPIALIREYYV